MLSLTLGPMMDLPENVNSTLAAAITETNWIGST